MAVGLGALGTADGLERCGDALGAAGPSNKPVGVVGGVLGSSQIDFYFYVYFYFFYKNDHALDPKGPTPGLI